jgi:hypothetical protein
VGAARGGAESGRQKTCDLRIAALACDPMDRDSFMRILEAAQEEDGSFPFRTFLDLFLEVRGRAQWATAADMLDFVTCDLSRIVDVRDLDEMTAMRAHFVARALKEYALQAWKLGPAEHDPAALPVEDVLFRTVN